MVVMTDTPPVADSPHAVAAFGNDPVGAASIAAYLGAGERMRVLMDMTWKVCAGLAVLVLLAWLAGILPGAVRLF